MADAIALIDDLFFQAKLRETAKLAGVTVETAATGEQLLRAAAASPAALVIVDLNARQGALEAVEQHRLPDAPGNPRRVIAFLSHVQTELAERARAAVCHITHLFCRSWRYISKLPRKMMTRNLGEPQ